MKNKAMFVSQNKKNKFTKRLSKLCKDYGAIECSLRNGTSVLVRYFGKKQLDETEEPHFHSDCNKYAWNLDGSSVKNDEYDIVYSKFLTYEDD